MHQRHQNLAYRALVLLYCQLCEMRLLSVGDQSLVYLSYCFGKCPNELVEVFSHTYTITGTLLDTRESCMIVQSSLLSQASKIAMSNRFHRPVILKSWDPTWFGAGKFCEEIQ